jgi:hypothetical protein
VNAAPGTIAIADAGFATPQQAFNSATVNPGGAWTFAGWGGISGMDAYGYANPVQPNSYQLASLPGGSTIGQSISGWPQGYYTASVNAAQSNAGGTPNSQSFNVLIDSASVGSITPSGICLTSW